MNRLARTLVLPALILALPLALAACGAEERTVSVGEVAASGATVGSDGVQAGGVTVDENGVTVDGQTTAAASPGTDGGDGEIRLPEFPVPRVPDVGAMTKGSAAVQKKIAAAGDLPVGLEVTGARCNAKGVVVNRTGVAVSDADDGSQVVTGGGTSQVDPNGSGQVVGSDGVWQVDADGSGQVTMAGATLQVDADGSGQYSDGRMTYQVDADGTGQYTIGDETYQVSKDGSGQWTFGGGSVQNGGDGTGTWTGPDGAVIVNGDGTGTLNGAPITVAAMPKFVLLGKLPKLNTLVPIGKRCGTLIRIDASVLFDFDKATLRPEAGPVLQGVAKALAATTATIQVNGHTDSKGEDAYNQDLSERRAAAVVAALKADGLKAPMTPQGFGETQPVAPNTKGGKDNPGGRQLNRRVELVSPETCSCSVGYMLRVRRPNPEHERLVGSAAVAGSADEGGAVAQEAGGGEHDHQYRTHGQHGEGHRHRPPAAARRPVVSGWFRIGDVGIGDRGADHRQPHLGRDQVGTVPAGERLVHQRRARRSRPADVPDVDLVGVDSARETVTESWGGSTHNPETTSGSSLSVCVRSLSVARTSLPQRGELLCHSTHLEDPRRDVLGGLALPRKVGDGHHRSQEVVLVLHQLDDPGRSQPAGEQLLVVVHVLTAGRVPGHDDRPVSQPTRLGDCGGTTMGDDHVADLEQLLQPVVAAEGEPRALHRGSAAAVLDLHVPVLHPARPVLGPGDQPVERMVIRAHGHEHPAGHSTHPTTSAPRYRFRCSSHCTSIASVNGRHSRPVRVGLSIRS